MFAPYFTFIISSIIHFPLDFPICLHLSHVFRSLVAGFLTTRGCHRFRRPSFALLGLGLRHDAGGHAGGGLPRCPGETAPGAGEAKEGGAGRVRGGLGAGSFLPL